MSNAVLKGNASGSGTVTLETPNTNTDRTISLPDATGTVMVSGNMPAFSAYASANVSCPSGTFTKMAFDTKVFDTNTNYSTASARFTPTVAGYYQINASLIMEGAATGIFILSLYKNGTSYARLANNSLNVTNGTRGTGSCLVYMNGTTDYLEIYGYQNYASSLLMYGADTVTSQWSGCLVRAA